MSKPLKLTLACLALLLLLIPAALLGLLSTDAGTRLVGKQLQRSLGDSLHWQHMQGALSGPLHITGLRYSQPGLSASAKQVVLDWDPTALLAGQLRVAKLSVDGLSLSFTSEDSKTASPPFSPADIQIPVDISIANAQLTQVQIIQGEKNLRVDDIQLKARLNGQELLIEAFHLSSADADLQLGGSLLLDDHMPLDIHTRWTWKKPESAPVSGAAQLTGDINWRQATSFDLEYGLNATGLSVLEEELPTSWHCRGWPGAATRAMLWRSLS